MVTYKITVLRIGVVTSDRGGLTRGTNCGTKLVIPQMCMAIEGNGMKILADTGVHSAEWVNENVSTVEGCYLEEDETMENALAAIGWKSEEVNIVINTHLHYDHCGNNRLFKNARILIQRDEWDFALNPTANQKQYYVSSLFVGEAGNGTNIELIDGEYEVAEGLVLIPTPGHTKGHQSVIINTKEGVVCYAGDAANLLENITNNIIGNILYDTAQAYKAIEDIKHKAEFVIPGHDPAIKKYATDNFLEIHK